MITIKTESFEITIDEQLNEGQIDKLVNIVTRETLKIIEAESKAAIEAASAGYMLGSASETVN